MYENGTYNPKMGRPVNDVNYIRESMTPKQAARGCVPKNAIGDEVEFPPKETLRTGPRTIGPEPKPEYPTADELLSQLYGSIEMLEVETSGLFAQIDRALADVSETQCQPRPGPRISNSNLTYRIAGAIDAIDELANRVNLIRNRITL